MKLAWDAILQSWIIRCRTELAAAERANVEAAAWQVSDQDGSFLALDGVNNPPGHLYLSVSSLAACESVQPPQQSIHPGLNFHCSPVSGVIAGKASDQF